MMFNSYCQCLWYIILKTFTEIWLWTQVEAWASTCCKFSFELRIEVPSLYYANLKVVLMQQLYMFSALVKMANLCWLFNWAIQSDICEVSFAESQKALIAHNLAACHITLACLSKNTWLETATPISAKWKGQPYGQVFFFSSSERLPLALWPVLVRHVRNALQLITCN